MELSEISHVLADALAGMQPGDLRDDNGEDAQLSFTFRRDHEIALGYNAGLGAWVLRVDADTARLGRGERDSLGRALIGATNETRYSSGAVGSLSEDGRAAVTTPLSDTPDAAEIARVMSRALDLLRPEAASEAGPDRGPAPPDDPDMVIIRV